MMDGDQLMSLLNKIAVEQNFQDYDIQITPKSTGGANYSSKLFCVTISGAGKDDLKLFAKVGVISKKNRSDTPLKPFESEKLVYTELTRTYRRLEEKHGVPEENRLKFPKYYGADLTYLQEVLVFEDLTSRGFASANRFESVDWQYAASAVTELAKFHALSMAYQHESPEEFEKIVTKFPRGMITENENTNKFFTASAEKALATVRKEYKEKLKQFLHGESLSTIYSMYSALRRQVLIHVDFKPNNMLHRVKDDNTMEVIPVDYQTIQGGSSVIDLLYFIFMATNGQFRAKYYKKLIMHYHSELGVALARLGLDVEDKYSSDDFEFELREKLRFGLLISVLVLPIVTIPEDVAPKVDGGLDMSSFAAQATGDQYSSRLNDVVDDFVAWGVL